MILRPLETAGSRSPRLEVPRWRRRHIPLPEEPDTFPPSSTIRPPETNTLLFVGPQTPYRPLSPLFEIEEVSSDSLEANAHGTGGDHESCYSSEDDSVRLWVS
jgi:hypothetical protein